MITKRKKKLSLDVLQFCLEGKVRPVSGMISCHARVVRAWQLIFNRWYPSWMDCSHGTFIRHGESGWIKVIRWCCRWQIPIPRWDIGWPYWKWRYVTRWIVTGLWSVFAWEAWLVVMGKPGWKHCWFIVLM